MKKLMSKQLVSVLMALAVFWMVGASPADAQIRVAAIGCDCAHRAAKQAIDSGDIAGTFTHLDAWGFNALSVDDLRANFDVLIFTWVSSPSINADWNTRLLPYMALGGGIIFEDPGNIFDLAPGVTASWYGSYASSTVSATIPGLTDGITSNFVNNHVRFTAWDPALMPFLTLKGHTTGLAGTFGAGRIVLTGPDQHYHGLRGGADPEGNQYNLMVNEILWVTEASPSYEPAPPSSEPVEDPDVRTQGFWKRVCARPHPSGEHENLPVYVGCVNATATFMDVHNAYAICDRLNPTPKKKRGKSSGKKGEQAEAQFMALLLNVCSGRVETSNCVNDPDLGETTVGDVVMVIDELLSNSLRTFEDCVHAQAFADRINNGLTLVPCP